MDYVEKWDDKCDILQVNFPGPKSIWLIKKVKSQNKKVIIWSHITAEDTQGVFKIFKYIFRPIRAYLKYIYNLADIILSPSEYTKSLLVGYGIDPNKIIVQSNGVDLKKFYPDQIKRENYKKKYNLEGTTTIGTVALAIKRKGLDTFIRLAKKHPNKKFIWFGKIYNSILAESLPKDVPSNCTFTGYVDDIVAAFNAIDIFVFPSYEENQGMVLLEAAAIGLPILVRDLPVYDGWLKDKENCLKAKTESEFEEHLEKLLTNNTLREKLSTEALSLAQKESLDSLGVKMQGIYSKITEHSH